MFHGLRSGSVVVILTVVLSGIGFSEEASSTLQIQDLQKVAQQHLDQGDILEASKIMESIVSDSADSKDVFWAQSNLAILKLQTQSDPNQGYALLSKIIASEPNTLRTGEFLYKAATILHKQKKYDQAKDLYSRIRDQWINTELGLKATVELLKTAPALENDPNGKQGIDELHEQYGALEKLPEALYSLANHYGHTQNPQKALYAFEQIEKAWPDSPYATGARMMSLAIADTVSQSDPNCSRDLLAEAVSVKNAPVCLDAIAEAATLYSEKARCERKYKQNPDSNARLQTMISLGQLFLIKDTSSPKAAQITFQVAQGCYDLGEYQKAADYYASVLSQWPTHPMVWHAQYRLGICYQAMEKAGLMDTESAQALTIKAYRELIAEFPNCPATAAASQWLNSQQDSVEGRI